MTTKIKWRLANRPTPAEVRDLHSAGLLTKDEAREILFSLETEEDRDKKSLQEEIKFLRSLVQSLSSRSNIVEHIYKVATPNYNQTPWWPQYQVYCSAGDTVSGTVGALNGSLNSLSANSINTVYTTSSSINDTLAMS